MREEQRRRDNAQTLSDTSRIYTLHARLPCGQRYTEYHSTVDADRVDVRLTSCVRMKGN